MIDNTDPRVQAKIRNLHAAAVSAGFENPIFGGLVIAAMALIRLEEEAVRGRHPDGKGGSGCLD